MLRFIILVSSIISIILIGCGSISYQYTFKMQQDVFLRRSIPVYVDTRFSEADKKTIRESILEWDYALNKQIIIYVRDENFDMEIEKIQQGIKENSWFILKIDNDHPELRVDTRNVLAWCDRIGGTEIRVVRDRFAEDDLHPIMLHEIGHLLYLKHIEDDESSLMFPIYKKGRYACIDKYTMKRVSDNYGLNFATINYCSK